MKSTTLNVSFYCRNSRADKKGFAPVELCIIINGERSVLTLPRKEIPQAFQKALKSRRPSDIMDYLNAVRKRLNDIITDMMEQGIYLSADILREYFQNGGVRSYTIQTLFDEYLEILKKREETGLTHRTIRKYELARDKFYQIIDKDKPVVAITSTIIAEYIRILKLEYNYATTNGYAQRIKTLVKYGMSKGQIKINPFIGVHLRKEGEIDVQFLTEQELGLIRDTDFMNDCINRVRDLFVFQSASGLSYCDMAALEPQDFQINQDGQLYIHKRRAKTNVYFTSVILPDGINIIKKYDYRLPLISNQKYNAYLKFIQSICKIDKPLHSHIARHSYATRCINEGIRLEVVAKLLGHSTTRITQHYARLLEKSIVNEVQDAFIKAKE